MNETAAALALTAAYWLHMLATVIWIGGLAAVSILVLPAARRALDPAAYHALMARIQPRLQQIGWFSLLVLAGTGMFQMSAHPAYDGLLTISSAWAAAILVKHLVIGLMVLVSAYVTWGLMPALQRSALLRSVGQAVDERQAEALNRREALLLRANLVLSIVVLALTALARASG